MNENFVLENYYKNALKNVLIVDLVKKINFSV